MPLMKSPAGDMEISISRITADRTQMITVGKFGAWDSTICFEADDVVRLMILMINWSVIWFIIRLPITYIRQKIGSSKRS